MKHTRADLLHLLAVCDAVSEPTQPVREALALGYDRAELVEPTLSSTRALVASMDHEDGTLGPHVVVAFRGTVADTQEETATNVLADALAIPTRPLGLRLPGRVHAGWWALLGKVYDPVMRVVNGYKPSTLWVTGFSLGGAMATGFWLVEPDSRCVTFGAPKLGTRRISRALDSDNVTRVALRGDLLARLPSSPYRHGGRAIVLPGSRHSRAEYAEVIGRAAPGLL